MPPQNEAEARVHAGESGLKPGQNIHEIVAAAGAAYRASPIRQMMGGLANNYRDPNEVRNPYFDERSRTRSGAGGVKSLSNLYRGYITQLRPETATIPGASGPKQRHVRFQYNPTTISLNYSINTDAFPEESRGSYDTAPILATTGQTMSFTLYFNRTYETLEGDKKVGVMADIQSLEYLLGSHDGGGMAAVELMVVFGMTKSGKPLAFAGWISDLNVEFIQFTHRMIPTVAMVQVGMVRRLIGNQVSGGESAPYAGAVAAASKSASTPTNGLGVMDPGLASLPRTAAPTQLNRRYATGGGGLVT